MNSSILCALIAAALFGASTPLAKMLIGDCPPILLAGLLYLGSGIGLTIARFVRDQGWRPSGLMPGEWPWLLGAILFGGILGPVALMFGLLLTSAATASLLLNLEAVLTALLAWVVFKENADRRIVLGMIAIIAGGVVLSVPSEVTGSSSTLGPALIAIACFCWAIDNNLTRKVSASDALFIAGSKGLIAGTVNSLLALLTGALMPDGPVVLSVMAIGLLGYGISLVLFVLALRGLGSARTGAYFSIAPFFGAAISIAVFGDTASWLFWLAAMLMAFGVWLHLTENHEHAHTHDPLEHSHRHTHDVHHQHVHNFPWSGDAPHEHLHRHVTIRHKHAHFPDIHHQHPH